MQTRGQLCPRPRPIHNLCLAWRHLGRDLPNVCVVSFRPPCYAVNSWNSSISRGCFKKRLKCSCNSMKHAWMEDISRINWSYSNLYSTCYHASTSGWTSSNTCTILYILYISLSLLLGDNKHNWRWDEVSSKVYLKVMCATWNMSMLCMLFLQWPQLLHQRWEVTGSVGHAAPVYPGPEERSGLQ